LRSQRAMGAAETLPVPARITSLSTPSTPALACQVPCRAPRSPTPESLRYPPQACRRLARLARLELRGLRAHPPRLRRGPLEVLPGPYRPQALRARLVARALRAIPLRDHLRHQISGPEPTPPTMSANSMYELYYWPTIQGRGEFVRLVLEEAGAPYEDVARSPKGMRAMMAILKGAGDGLVPFAPPFIRHGDAVIAQTANILSYLAPRHGLAPLHEAGRAAALELQLTMADLLVEVHDSHHPIASSLYYEDQKAEAKRRSSVFVAERLTKFLGWMEKVLDRAGGKYFIGGHLSYVDLSLFQIIAGLRYAFPNAMARLAPAIPRLSTLADHVAARPRIAAYLASDRRLAFNAEGIFRHYPELDAASSQKNG
jgi:glutathione S-transferase